MAFHYTEAMVRPRFMGSGAFFLRFRQALAVVNDMTEPEDKDDLRGLNLMRTQVGLWENMGSDLSLSFWELSGFFGALKGQWFQWKILEGTQV